LSGFMTVVATRTNSSPSLTCGTVECPVPNPLRTSTHGPLMSPTHPNRGVFKVGSVCEMARRFTAPPCDTGAKWRALARA
jgi:hypothetical protein